MDVVVLQKTAEALPDFPYPVAGNFKLEEFKRYYDFYILKPSSDLAPYIAYYSIFQPKLSIGHDLQFTQILQVPAASLMFSRKKSLLFGVTTKRINHHAKTGDTKIRVIFKPAGLHAFLHKNMASLVDKSLEISHFSPMADEQYVSELMSAHDHNDVIKKLDRLLLSQQPVFDKNIVMVNEVIKNLDDNDTLTTVKDIAALYGKSERWMQELFREYVGVGLKWVVIRSRLLKVLQEVESPKEIQWAQLAAETGYSTQSHLINDFKALIGKTPSQYLLLRNSEPVSSKS